MSRCALGVRQQPRPNPPNACQGNKYKGFNSFQAAKQYLQDGVVVVRCCPNCCDCNYCDGDSDSSSLRIDPDDDYRMVRVCWCVGF